MGTSCASDGVTPTVTQLLDRRSPPATGTLRSMRHEVGVVEYPDGGRYAVAVFTQSQTTEQHQPHLDSAIGRIGHLLITQLRLTA